MDTNLKEATINKIIKKMGCVLIAFSGGVDSTLLAKLCSINLGDNVLAVTIDGGINSVSEIEQTKELAYQLKINHLIVKKNLIADTYFRLNSKQRCYYCKKSMAQILNNLKIQNNLSWIIDGSNVDDLNDFRPGFEALKEFSIRSPFIEANMTKNDIRALAKHLGLKIWDKPSQGCLATRIPYNNPITNKKLKQIEKGESLLNKMGYYPVRLRHNGDEAKIEFSKNQLPEKILTSSITMQIREIGFKKITVSQNIFCRK